MRSTIGSPPAGGASVTLKGFGISRTRLGMQVMRAFYTAPSGTPPWGPPAPDALQALAGGIDTESDRQDGHLKAVGI